MPHFYIGNGGAGDRHPLVVCVPLVFAGPLRGVGLTWCGSYVVWVSRGVGLPARSPRNGGAVLLGRSPRNGVAVLLGRSPRKFPSTVTYRNLTPRCARERGPGGPPQSV